MSIRRRFPIISLFAVGLIVGSIPLQSDAQFFGSDQIVNPVEYDLLNILTCGDFDPMDEPENYGICVQFQEDLIEDMLQSQEFIDQVFTGFRNDLPVFLRTQLPDKIFIQVRLAEIDDVGGTLAQAGPLALAEFGINPFLRRRSSIIRNWSIPIAGFMEIDVDDLPFMILSDIMVDVAVHETFHALGHPVATDRAALNGPTTVFGQIHYIGVDGGGFGLVEYREESENPFAQFIPLSQFDDHAHLSQFSDVFNRPAEGIQEVFLAFANLQGFMSNSLRGMFADVGFKIRTVNQAGIIDLDGDGINDDPLIINPDTDP